MAIKKILISISKTFYIYHPLQSRYRHVLLQVQNRKLRKSYAAYKGRGFICNYCGSSFSKFASRFPRPEDRLALVSKKVIAGYGENVYCPECMSTSRERLVIAQLADMNIAGWKVLHLAPEEKVWRILKSQCKVISADISPGYFATIDKHIQYADATRLTFEDQSFDMVIANHIMEHIPEDRKAMREIYRVLKSTGTAIMQIPFSLTLSDTIEDPAIHNSRQQSALYGQKDHVRIYSINDYLERLAEAGFKVHYRTYESLGDLYKYAIQPHEGFIELRRE